MATKGMKVNVKKVNFALEHAMKTQEKSGL